MVSRYGHFLCAIRFRTLSCSRHLHDIWSFVSNHLKIVIPQKVGYIGCSIRITSAVECILCQKNVGIGIGHDWTVVRRLSRRTTFNLLNRFIRKSACIVEQYHAIRCWISWPSCIQQCRSHSALAVLYLSLRSRSYYSQSTAQTRPSAKIFEYADNLI